jgi:hypothetical protein
MSVITSLEDFFAKLATENDLDQLVQEKREEDLHLEFKQKRDRRDCDLHDDDRRAFSKAVSGFANADGGVLVFGIETKHSRDNPDRAEALRPITNAERFRAKLLDSILNTTHPPVDGVRVEVIAGKPGEGYVKCLIPQSDTVPHRGVVADHHYWRRTSTGFRMMDHYELEEVFGRRLRPVLRLRVELRPRADPDRYDEVHFWLLNEGRGLARHAGLACFFGRGLVVGVDGSAAMRNASGINDGRPFVYYYDPHIVVHPNGIFTQCGHAIIGGDKRGGPMSINVKWYAEFMALRSAEIVLEPNVMQMLK